MAKPLISVCIPAYEMHGHGAMFLSHSLSKLATQEFKDFEVVVSDQSNDDAVAKACSAFSSKLDIVYLNNRSGKRQSSANTNNAIANARGSILKFLFQDDFLFDSRSLSIVAEAFESRDTLWLATGCVLVTNDTQVIGHFHPKYNDYIQYGRNTLSSPSVIALVNDDPPLFDENLIWLMDVDYYKRCRERYGLPRIINDVAVATRIHPDQVSHSVGSRIKRRELFHVYKKHWRRDGIAGAARCLRRYQRSIN